MKGQLPLDIGLPPAESRREPRDSRRGRSVFSDRLEPSFQEHPRRLQLAFHRARRYCEQARDLLDTISSEICHRDHLALPHVKPRELIEAFVQRQPFGRLLVRHPEVIDFHPLPSFSAPLTRKPAARVIHQHLRLTP